MFGQETVKLSKRRAHSFELGGAPSP